MLVVLILLTYILLLQLILLILKQITFTVSDNVAIGGVLTLQIHQTMVLHVLTKTYEYDNYNYGSQTQTETAIVTDSAGNTSNSTLQILS